MEAKNLIAKAQITINATADKAWEALTNLFPWLVSSPDILRKQSKYLIVSIL